MRTKSLFTMMAAAALLTACSNDLKDVQGAPEIAQDITEADAPIAFDAYVNRATTRAGAAGVLTTTGANDGEVSLEEQGFGVFGYYTDDDFYSPIYAPNFMYNTKVSKGTSGNWEYSPLMYWPNEFGSDAISENVDRVSFFAYAPWVDVTPTSGAVKGDDSVGIIGLSRNGAIGDPFVKYAVSFDPAKSVDLTYGVANEDFTSSVSSVPNNVKSNSLFLNLTKPAVGAKLKFNFKHALAALNVQIDAAVDDIFPGIDLDANTRIFVRSVTFNGFATKGALNLNANSATWYDLSGTNYLDGAPVTIYDGRSNGYEAISPSINESPVGLNNNIIQSTGYKITGSAISVPAVTAGVTKNAQNLFNPSIVLPDPSDTGYDAAVAAALAQPIYVIPTGQTLTITVAYDIETYNPNLSGSLSDGLTHGARVHNVITKSVPDFVLHAGYLNVVKMHLGLTTVEFEAAVKDWNAGSTKEASPSFSDNVKSTLNELKSAVQSADATQLESLRSSFIGFYLNSDGTLSSSYTSKSVGIIAQLSNTSGELDTYPALNGANIMVMSFEDIKNPIDGSSTMSWSKVESHNPTGYHDRIGTNFNADYKTNKSGYRVSQEGSESSNLVAIPAAWNYNLGIDGIAPGYGLPDEIRNNGTPADTSDDLDPAIGHWFLPTAQQMVESLGCNNKRYEAGVSEIGPTKKPFNVCTNIQYWSCSTRNGTNSYRYSINGTWSNPSNLNNEQSIRAVFVY